MENKTRAQLRKEQEQARKEQKKQQSPLGKIIAIGLALIVVLGGAGFFYWQNEQEAMKQAFDKKTTALLAETKTNLDETGIGTTEKVDKDTEKKQQVVSYLPTTPTATTDSMTEPLNALIKQGKENLKDHWGTVVAYLDVHHVTDQLTEIQPKVVSYSWNKQKKTFVKKEFKDQGDTFINQSTQAPLTATDLFPEKADLLGMFTVLQQKILDDSGKGNEIVDEVLAMERPTAETLNFTYTPDGITVHLGENNFGLTDVDLPFDSLSGYVNPSFVDPTKITNTEPQLEEGKKYISLTFDDGVNSTTTPQLLDTLEATGVKATFFILGENAQSNPDVLKRIVDDGHEVANHSWDHAVLTSQTTEEVQQEIRSTSKLIYQATGVLPHFVRPPYGAVDAATAETIGLPIIQWNVDSSDWELKNKDAIVSKVTNNTFNGTILLLHDIHQFSVDSVPEIISQLQQQGYEFVTLEQMLGKTKPLYQYFGLYSGAVDKRLVQ